MTAVKYTITISDASKDGEVIVFSVQTQTVSIPECEPPSSSRKGEFPIGGINLLGGPEWGHTYGPLSKIPAKSLDIQ